MTLTANETADLTSQIDQAKKRDYRQVVILNWLYQDSQAPTRVAFLLPREPQKDLQALQNLTEKYSHNVNKLLSHCCGNYPRHDFLADDDATVLPAQLTKTSDKILAVFCQQGQTIVRAEFLPPENIAVFPSKKDMRYEAISIRSALKNPETVKLMAVEKPQGYPDNKFQISFAKAAHMKNVLQ